MTTNNVVIIGSGRRALLARAYFEGKGITVQTMEEREFLGTHFNQVIIDEIIVDGQMRFEPPKDSSFKFRGKQHWQRGRWF